ncbi:MAG: class I SAM-dependent methyltransferase [Acidobacteriota bacterium]
MKSTLTLHRAALESSTIFNRAVAECAVSSGLMNALGSPRTVAELITLMGFAPERRSLLEELLSVLCQEGLVKRHQLPAGGPTVYRAQRPSTVGDTLGRYRPREDAISSWYGERHANKIRSSNRAFLGRDLSFFRSAGGAIHFDGRFEEEWRINLQNPLYEFGRERCVRWLVENGGHSFLDLACGLGYGSERLAQFSEGPVKIVAVDKSRDFLDLARLVVYPDAAVRFVQRDLNEGLPPLPAEPFDGVLFNGSFHFIRDKAAMLRSVAAHLQPGGRLAIGHCFSSSGFEDEAMHRFYFSLLAEAFYLVPWDEIKRLTRDAGFVLIDEFHRGSHSYLVAQKSGLPASEGSSLQPGAWEQKPSGSILEA